MLQTIKRLTSRLLNPQPICANTAEPQASHLSDIGFREHLIDIQNHRVFVRTCGAPSNKAVICWHGFARNGSDFSTIARHLASKYFVICPDTPGRGLSDWLPKKSYNLSYYQLVAISLIKNFNIRKRLHWIGTSMGGVLGMIMAADPNTQKYIDRLVVNDVGPEVPQEAIRRIREYASQKMIFKNLAESEKFFRQIYAPFGNLSEQEWQLLVAHSVRRLEDGNLTQHYDPAILEQFEAPQNRALAWAMFSSITCRILLIRGADSDVLPERIANRMVNSALRVERLDVKDVGHAPFLNTTMQIEKILSFLES
ncbi:MAG TPA: alpha/beta hydrolase [Gammaproteobacteria bacterium]|nr:alpha/beta hydrolase [Gammaproteobacteria bacterium]